ncbi:App1 family protein [Segetibacter aerophilus]|nr:App1 family protein [Segetibacter aerophilus]
MPIAPPTAKISFFDRLEKKLLNIFRLTNEPVVKVYHGYGNVSQMIVFGHVFSLSPLPRKRYRKNFWTNTFALLRSFMVVRIADANVRMVWGGTVCETTTAKDGFFRFEWKHQAAMAPGSYKIQVQYYSKETNAVFATGIGSVIIPFVNQYSFISDIDDTFLVSHSSNIRKRLYVLLTKNAHSRKPFEGVVSHYKLLALAQTTVTNPNPFFYVSSSEWNLYDFIKEFTRKNELPEGVFLLSQIKRLAEVWKTGATKHSTKFMRIARIFEAYPTQRFVLLGDDSQQDPIIYAGIVTHFPGRVISVYLRHVYEKNLTNVKEEIRKIEAAGVQVCHFVHSKEAIEHSYRIGLIQKNEEHTTSQVSV